MSILSVGTVAFDCIETPHGKREDILGGSASYLSVAAAYFHPVRMVAVVGSDFPEEHLQFFRSRDIDTRGIHEQPGRTFRWRGHYLDNINEAKTIETQLNVLADFEPNLSDDYKGSEYVILGNIDPHLQTHVVNQVHAPKLIACDTMNYWINNSNAALKQTLKNVDILSINDGEAKLLSGEDNILKAARAIRSMGPKILIIKRGEYGATIFHQDDVFISPAFPLEEVKDPTGAGDSFAGGMIGYLARAGTLNTETLKQAVIMGSAIASFAVQDFSLDRFRTLKRTNIQERFNQFHQLTQFSRNTVS